MSSTVLKNVRLDLKPGMDRQSTRYAVEGGWWDGDKVRFRDGRAENMRGWVKKVDEEFIGTSRVMLTWNDLEQSKLAAWATECRVYVYKNGMIHDITPFRTTTTVNNGENTTADSIRVVISAVGHGGETGDYVVFTSAAVTVGGNVFLTGEYAISVVDADSFAVDYSVSAAATSANAGGLLTINYLLQCGTSVNVAGLGWGTGLYGAGTWGTARSSSNVILEMRQWSMDTWGEDLVVNLRNGPTYVWNASAGTSQRAQIVSAVPSITSFIMVSPEDRHMIALGTTDQVTGVFDPLLIRWSDTENYNQWTAAVTNAAGDFILAGANKIIGAVNGPRASIIFTDDTAHEMRYTGFPDTFGFRILGSNAGLIGPHAAVESNGVVYWMSTHNFHKYDGEISIIPCPLLRHVFSDSINDTHININQKEKVYAGTNKEFNEVIWLYPAIGSDEIDSYVVYNINDGTWVKGSFDWTTWSDQGIFDNVIVAGSDHFLRDHELEDVYTGDGAAYESFIESGDFDIGDGDDIMFIDRFIPDFDLDDTGAIHLFITTLKYPGSTETVTKGPFVINGDTAKISLRARGRQLRLRFSTSAVGTGVKWRMGSNRISLGPSGKR